MDSKMTRLKSHRSVLRLLQSREVNSEAGNILRRRLQFTESSIKRLGLETELEGHQGCVNCVQWSPNGRHLASGSDDTNVILWDPFRHEKLGIIPTPHIGNIFSVKFLGNENVIATAAGDCRVIVQSASDAGASKISPAPLLDCSCHVGRVKRLATSPDQPSLFWSAGEDGLVLQYDMREPHNCTVNTKILIDLSEKSEIKCVTVNPTKPHLIAVGANDCFVRLYDTRKISALTGNLSLNQAKKRPSHPQRRDCVQYYGAGHLAKENSNIIIPKLAVTYIAFNSAGSEMLVNVGGEQIYLFNLNESRHVNELKVPQYLPKRSPQSYKNCCKPLQESTSSKYNGVNSNELFDKNVDCACFYMKRAQRCYHRKWMSDLYGAARDYLHVIQYFPEHKQAYIGLIKCLVTLKWDDEANVWLSHFLKLYPDCENTAQVKIIMDDLRALKNSSPKSNSTEEFGVKKVDEEEKTSRLDSFDFEKRYLGHCNTTTDIKEANFLGDGENFICAGSDEGIIFIWDKNSMGIVRGLFGDNSIVNCVQPHPSACIIASSGIDNGVKIWSPSPEDIKLNTRIVKNMSSVMEKNQHLMCMDPFESMLLSMGFNIPNSEFGANSYIMDEQPTCRTS